MLDAQQNVVIGARSLCPQEELALPNFIILEAVDDEKKDKSTYKLSKV